MDKTTTSSFIPRGEVHTGNSTSGSASTAIQRPSFEEIYMRLALSLSERSTCHRLKVGTLITTVDFRKVLAVGYNGNASGLTNGCDRKDEPGNCGCLHSEENAVINCDSPRHIEKIAFVTHMPCALCAKRLFNLGQVKKVYYHSEYRTSDACQLLNHVGIELISLKIQES